MANKYGEIRNNQLLLLISPLLLYPYADLNLLTYKKKFFYFCLYYYAFQVLSVTRNDVHHEIYSISSIIGNWDRFLIL